MTRKYELLDSGYALQVIRLHDGADFFLQGDDANYFREEWSEYDPSLDLADFIRDAGYDILLETH